MKTPREILLQRHQAATPKLDAARREILNAEFKRVGQASRPSLAYLISRMVTGWKFILRVVWDGLIFPSRRIWAGLAAVWLVIFAVNISLRDHSRPAMARSSPTPEMFAAWRQQERVLAELIGPNETHFAEPPKQVSPQPRSERLEEFMLA